MNAFFQYIYIYIQCKENSNCLHHIYTLDILYIEDHACNLQLVRSYTLYMYI